MNTSEKTKITVETTVNANADKVWEIWTSPDHITKWNSPGGGWHTPKAKHELKPGGNFNYRMEAEDGSAGFDFEGTFDEIKNRKYIGYTIADGRKVEIIFKEKDNKTQITETFEVEDTNSVELQHDGWQAILNNFKTYAESKTKKADLKIQKITPFLWFNSNAEEAVNFYTSVFKNSGISSISRYTEAGFEYHHKPAGTAMTISFSIEGQNFTALNGGTEFKFNESISFVVTCKDQEELDYYWKKLSEDGDPDAQMCGWLKDKFGVSWQIVPEALGKLMSGKNGEKVASALFQMKKLNIAELEKAAEK